MINRDDWLNALREATEAPLPESNAVSVKEFAALAGIKCCHAARKRLLGLVELGKARKTTKQIRRSDGMTITVTAYELVN